MSRKQILFVVIVILIASSYQVYIGVKFYDLSKTSITGVICDKTTESTRHGDRNLIYVEWESQKTSAMTVSTAAYLRTQIGSTIQRSYSNYYSPILGMSHELGISVPYPVWMSVYYIMYNGFLAFAGVITILFLILTFYSSLEDKDDTV